jgi:hypothetical protein
MAYWGIYVKKGGFLLLDDFCGKRAVLEKK